MELNPRRPDHAPPPFFNSLLEEARRAPFAVPSCSSEGTPDARTFPGQDPSVLGLDPHAEGVVPRRDPGEVQDGALEDRTAWVAAGLEAAGLRVLLDDRTGVSPGVRFKDAELIGVPTIAVAGRGVADESRPTIEVKDRRTGDRIDVPVAEAVDHLVAVCRP